MNIEQDLDTAGASVMGIIGSVDAAAKILADLCKKHPGFICELHKRLKMQVSIAYLRRLERCGNGELHPSLCLCVGPGQPFIEKLSRTDQEKVIGGVQWPDGDSHRIRPLAELEYHEAKAAFFGGVIADAETIKRRTRAHDASVKLRARKWASDEAMRRAEGDASMADVESRGIRYDSGYVIVPKNTKIKAEHLAEWLYRHGH